MIKYNLQNIMSCIYNQDFLIGVIPVLVFPVSGYDENVVVLTIYKILLIYICCAFVGLDNKQKYFVHNQMALSLCLGITYKQHRDFLEGGG